MITTHTDFSALVWTPAAEVTSSAGRRLSRRLWVTVALTAGALGAFAANTLLARLAMAGGLIEPGAYSAVRLLSTAVALAAIGALLPGRSRPAAARTRLGGSWTSAALLLGAILASTAGLAFVDAATGALLFFVTAQAAMFAAGLAGGERPSRLQWAGVAGAVTGLAWMLAPGAQGSSLAGSTLLVAAGGCWGLYSLRGRGSEDPFVATRGNFLRCLPVAAPAALLLLPGGSLSAAALVPPVISGAVASSLGSVLWYAVTRRLDATRAATAQLTVPVLSAVGGVALLGEPISERVLLAGALVLVGAAVAVAARQ